MIGQTIHHYEILEEIGSGGMGTVYKAHDIKLDRFVALKFLASHLSRDENEKKRFIHEARAISALDHPNICSIFEINETDDGQMYIAMACYQGNSLRDVIKKEEHLPVERVVDIAVEIADGLAAAHSKDIVHRDIKPANVLITDQGKVKIVDFGLAKLAGKSMLTKAGSTLGTTAYMSPEQARGEEVDRRTDIWAFGVVLYEMLAGVHPFKGEYDQAIIFSIINDEPEVLSKLNPEVPKDLEKIVTHALEKDPASRYQTADEMLNDLKECRKPLKGEITGELTIESYLKKIRRPKVAIPSAAIIILIILSSIWYFNKMSNVTWAKEVELPKIQNLVDHSWRDFTAAYNLEKQAEKYIPDNPELEKLITKSTLKLNITTEPSGAKVYYKQYNHPNDKWEYLGVTPLEKIRLPVGIFRWKFEKQGYDTVFAAASSWDINATQHNIIVPHIINRVLDKTGSIPAGMVRVTGAKTQLGEVRDFFIDKYEVTNKEYKKFIDAGGYRDKKYWKYKFIKDGKELTWQEAMKLFVDRTGRPGPSTWQAEDYPEGQGNYPVSGISWYEAAAYADFVKKDLPTATHWGLARGESTPLIRYPQLGGFSMFAKFSNFSNKGLVPVGSLQGITAYGANDMAGNVREWCWNNTPKGRVVRGGAWNDPAYLFDNLSQAPSFNRSFKNGFRCIVYPKSEKIPKQVFGIVTNFGNFDYYTGQKPVPDDVFRVYKEQFKYDKTDLKSRIEIKKEAPEWNYEKITFNAAYSNDRIIAHLFLPKNTAPPYQTVIYFPGSVVNYQKSSNDIESYMEFTAFLSFIVKNGRAVLFPVYKGTFERSKDGIIPEKLLAEGKLHQFTEYRIQIVKDFERCIDYLSTRKDIDTSKIAFYGLSWGSILGTIIPAVEDHLKASILISGGLVNWGLPEVNQINYITRVKIPTLMLNGKYDMILPFDKSIKPMYDLLGTPQKDKELKLFDSDHIPPENSIIKETLAWLDKYLGPVK